MGDYSSNRSNPRFNNFFVPTEYHPGMGLISQVILSDKKIINTITETLVNAPDDFYVTESFPSLDKRVSNVLYIPSGPSNTMPHILINTIDIFEEMIFQHIMLQCLKIHDMYHTTPICIIIVAQEIDEAMLEASTVYQELPFFREIMSTFWAKKCLLISSKNCWMNRHHFNYHPLLDIVFSITDYKKVTLSIDNL